MSATVSPHICAYYSSVKSKYELRNYYRNNQIAVGGREMSTSEHNLKIVKDMIESDNVVIFSKTYCPHCEEVKKICGNLRKPFTCYELDTIEEGDDIQSTLEDITGARTVPRIFVEGKCLGGASDFQSLFQNGDIYNVLNVKKTSWLVNLKNRLMQFFTRSN